MRLLLPSVIVALYCFFSLVLPLRAGFVPKALLGLALMAAGLKYVFYQVVGGGFFRPVLPVPVMLAAEALYAALLVLFFLALIKDAAGLGLTALLPDWFSPIAGVYPIFFCSAFQWGVYSGADGFNSATVFITNNFKQSVLGWTQYALTKDKEFKRKAVLYSNTVLMFFLGALLGVTGVAAFGNALGACVGFIPLAVARIFISIGELPIEDETPEETEEEAEEMMEEAKILEKEEKKKI